MSKTRVGLNTVVISFLAFGLLSTALGAVLAPTATAAWLEPWAHRALVTVTNPGATALVDYQVHIALDSSFPYSDALPDGSDLRVTAADELTLLPFWVESWAPPDSASLWVKVPSLPANGSITLFLYWGNPAAASVSDGYGTFDFFDDFETGSPAWAHEQGDGTFASSTEQARRGTSSGRFVQATNTGESSIWSRPQSLASNFLQEWDLYDDLDTTAFKMVRVSEADATGEGAQVGVGVWTGASAANYAYHNATYSYSATAVPRSAGWHKLGIRITPDATATYYVDGAQVGQLPGQTNSAAKVTVEGVPQGPTTYYVDDIRVRKYAAPEPTAVLGGEDTADVGISKADSPDPIRPGNPLTYHLTVSNSGPLEATNVTVTDDLPAGVTFGSATPSQGACSGTDPVVCELGSLASGGSATVDIVVTPTEEGTLSNTATVTATEPDLNQANNSATASTSVGDAMVYVVLAVDTEADNNHPMSAYHTTFDTHNYYKSATPTTISRVMADSFRYANRDSAGTPFKMSWYMEMDNFINQGLFTDGTPMDYLTLYDLMVDNWSTELETWGDELDYHHHFMYWNGSAWVQSTGITGYDEHNNALDYMVVDAEYFPPSFRSGWLWTNNDVQAWVEDWMLSDFSSAPWSGAPTSWIPYHPSPEHYTVPGSMNHWIARCDGEGANATNVNTAFAEARAGAEPVIYCWFTHSRSDMYNQILSAQSYLNAASQSTGIPFYFATATEAMQAIIGSDDTTPPSLAVAGSTPSFTVTSDETLWGTRPYVAARYMSDNGFAYDHFQAEPSGINNWTVTVPEEITQDTIIPAAPYTIVGATAQSAKPGYPATAVIDGNPATYWDSYELPQWIQVDLGTARPVRQMTVHFYDSDTRQYTYYVESSTDGTNWTALVPSSTVHGLATHTFDPAVTLRYARVTVTNNTLNAFAHILEIGLYETTETTVSEDYQLQQVCAGAGDLYGNTSTGCLAVRPMVDLVLTKSDAPDPVQVGENIVYTLEVTNHGPSAASDVTVVDTLPDGVEFLSVSPECTGTGPVTCHLGDLDADESASVSITIAPTAIGTLVNSATVTSTERDLHPADNSSTASTYVGNPLVYAVFAIDTEADNNHPTGAYHTVFDVHNYQRSDVNCPAFVTKYSNDGSTWSTYADGSVFNFQVMPAGEADPVTAFTCGTSNAYGLDDYSRAVAFTVSETGLYDVQVQISVVGSPPETHIYVVPDVGGNPDMDPAHRLSDFALSTSTIQNGQYNTIASDVQLTGGTTYWWFAQRQAYGDDSNQFAVYRGLSGPGGGTTVSAIMDPDFRSTHLDSFGQPFKMSWYMEMDNFINQGVYADGTPMTYMTLYEEMVRNWAGEITGYGDEIAYHHHFSYWNGAAWIQSNSITGYDEHNNALDHMVLDAGICPTNFRSGWLWTDNDVQAWIEPWLLADFGGSSASWIPYHPSAVNYTQPGDMNHWIARCPSGVTESGIASAFAEAQTTGRPVIYCWYAHKRDNMAGIMANAHSLLSSASTTYGIPFQYATSNEALQGVVGMTDDTPPEISISSTGPAAFTITSDEPLWGDRPYLAARYGQGPNALYTHIPAVPAGANTWSIELDTQRTVTVDPHDYRSVGATASAAHVDHPARLTIDDNLSSYWDSTPQTTAMSPWLRVDLGSIKPVAMLNVHFYDADGRSYTYYLDSSTDGSTWTPLVTESAVSGEAIHTFDPAAALRYVRLTVTGSSTGDYAHVLELNLYDGAAPREEVMGLMQVGACSADMSSNSTVASYGADPTAVVLGAFDAQAGPGKILLNWATATEIDTVGFNLYRADSRDGDYVRLNGELIAAQAPGSLQGVVYRWEDAQVEQGRSYYYKLEVLSNQGTSVIHGPVSAVLAAPAAHTIYLPVVTR